MSSFLRSDAGVSPLFDRTEERVYILLRKHSLGDR
jgi:hypothetical protein